MIQYFLPEITILAGILVVLILEIVLGRKGFLATLVSLLFLLVAGFFALRDLSLISPDYYKGLGAFINEHQSLIYIIKSLRLGVVERFMDAIMIVGTIYFVLLSYDYFRSRASGDYQFLTLSALLGGMLLIKSNNWPTLLLSLEILSFSLYALVAFRKDLFSYEAAGKYFFLGALSTAFLTMGIAFLYLAYGTIDFGTTFQRIYTLAQAGFPREVIVLSSIALAFIIVGFGFKLSAVPFHFWTPDVFEGAPTPTAGFVSTVSKTAAIGLVFAIFQGLLVNYPALWKGLILWLSVITMLVGNIAALRENSVKKLLAFSTIANAGYVLAVVYAGGLEAVKAAIVFMLVYTITTFGAFAVLQITSEGNTHIENLRGLFQRKPDLAFALAALMVSLAGIPPFAGFFAKFFLAFSMVQMNHPLLAIWLFFNGAISAYYYLRVVYYAFQKDDSEKELPSSRIPYAVAVVSAVLVLLMGLFPDAYTSFVDKVFGAFFGL